MYSVGLTGLQTNPSPVTQTCNPGSVAKTGSTTPPCNYTFSNAAAPFTVAASNLNQGANTLTGTAQDAGGNPGTSPPLTVYADFTTPTISFSPVSDTGNDPDPGVAPNTTLTIAATDSSTSGVVSGINSNSFTVSVEDDTTGTYLPSSDIQFQSPGCSPGTADSCTDTATLNTAGFPAGNYTIASQAMNVAGTPTNGIQYLNFELAGTHTETWAYDDSMYYGSCNGGYGASAAFVQQWLTYAEMHCGDPPINESNGEPKAVSDCATACTPIEYIDPNLEWSGTVVNGHIQNQSDLYAPLQSDAGPNNSGPAPEQWFVHKDNSCDAADRVTFNDPAPEGYGTAYLMYQGAGGLAAGGQTPCQTADGSPYTDFGTWLDGFVNTNFPQFGGLMVDDTGVNDAKQLYGNGMPTYSTSAELPFTTSDPDPEDDIAEHNNLASEMRVTGTNNPYLKVGARYLQIDNSWNYFSYNPQPIYPNLSYNDADNVKGMLMEGAPWTSGTNYTVAPDATGAPSPAYYATVLDSMAWVTSTPPSGPPDTSPQDFLTLLSYDPGNLNADDLSETAPSHDAGDQHQGRLIQEATVMLGYAPGKIVSWADLENPYSKDDVADPFSTDLAVWPEEGIYPTDPVQTMTYPSDDTGQNQCLTGTGGEPPTCDQGGHNKVLAYTVPNGAGFVYRREFRDCFNRGTPIGPCAAIVNDSATSQAVQASWLSSNLSYKYVATLEPGPLDTNHSDPTYDYYGWDVQSGGWINTCGQQNALVPGQDLVTSGSSPTTIAAWSAIIVDGGSGEQTCDPT
jgi:hypothetical protein